MRLIDADVLRERMYHDAFETDSNMQKWDSGCWIRYKMFENALEEALTLDAEPVVRCKDCRYRYQDGASFCLLGNQSDDWFCADGERREDNV